MQQTFIYKLPVREAYTYSLVFDDCRRPDEIDEEGTIHQILFHDREHRLVKVERYVDGELATEKCIDYEGTRVMKEREFFIDTGTANEIRYHYFENGYRKEFFIDGVLEYTEEYRQNQAGVTTAFRAEDPDGGIIRRWEANDKGNVTLTEEDGRLTTYDYHYNAAGLAEAIIVRDGDDEIRETLSYQDGRLVKTESFQDDVCVESTMLEYDEKGEVVRTENREGEVTVAETALQNDPEGRFKIRLQKRLVSPSPGRRMGHEYLAGKVEILYDDQKRISDVLTSGDRYIDQGLGIELEADAYFFFEYEEG